MRILLAKSIQSNPSGYEFLIDLFHKAKTSSETNIIFDFKNTTWFEANLAAMLGAIIELLNNSDKNIFIENVNSKIRSILRRNKFLYGYGYSYSYPDDSYNTIIPYKTFSHKNDDGFMNYIKHELLTKPDFPSHSKLLGKKISQNIFELYENARTHGLCKKIHTCGQYYPNKKPKRLDITIVDMGITIKTNVNEYLGKKLCGYDTIKWALKYGNTTKTGNISGGLGLDIIFKFIKHNEGKIQIISADGYWEFRKGRTSTTLFDYPFPGTIANLEFNLDDKTYYFLKEEIPLDDIF